MSYQIGYPTCQIDRRHRTSKLPCLPWYNNRVLQSQKKPKRARRQWMVTVTPSCLLLHVHLGSLYPLFVSKELSHPQCSDKVGPDPFLLRWWRRSYRPIYKGSRLLDPASEYAKRCFPICSIWSECFSQWRCHRSLPLAIGASFQLAHSL